jgi:methyltransferase (TIGR00027 family)
VKALGLAGANVTYVPVDFERQSLDEELVAGGFRAAVRTLFIWEGVTNYLTARAVDATLATVVRLSGQGSVLVFTYIDAGVVDGSVSFPEAGRWSRNVSRAGEPWIFGLAPEATGAFLASRGFTLESDVSTKQAGAGWFPAVGRREVASALYHVAVARAK